MGMIFYRMSVSPGSLWKTRASCCRRRGSHQISFVLLVDPFQLIESPFVELLRRGGAWRLIAIPYEVARLLNIIAFGCTGFSLH